MVPSKSLLKNKCILILDQIAFSPEKNLLLGLDFPFETRSSVLRKNLTKKVCSINMSLAAAVSRFLSLEIKQNIGKLGLKWVIHLKKKKKKIWACPRTKIVTHFKEKQDRTDKLSLCSKMIFLTKPTSSCVTNTTYRPTVCANNGI